MKDAIFSLHGLDLEDLEASLQARMIAEGLPRDFAIHAARQMASDPEVVEAARKAAN